MRAPWALAAAVLASLIGLTLLLHPWLLAFALRAWASSSGAKIGGIEVHGYHALEISDLVMAEPLAVEAARLRAPLPWGWWRARTGDAVVRVENWKLTLASDPQAESEESGGTPVDLFQTVTAVFDRLEQFLPGAELRDGVLRFGERAVAVKRVRWDGNELEVAAVFEDRPVEGSAQRTDAHTLSAELSALDDDISGELEVRSDGDGVELDASLEGWAGTARATASWADSWVPDSARAEVVKALALPAPDPLNEWRVASGTVRWSFPDTAGEGALELLAEGTAAWSSAKGEAISEDWEVDLRGARGEDLWRVSTARVTLPFFEASLDQAVEIARSDWVPRGGPARWSFSLGENAAAPVPWPVSADGVLELSTVQLAELGAGLGLDFDAAVEFEGEPFEVSARARLHRERIVIKKVSLAGSQGSTATAAAQLDVPARQWSDGTLRADVGSDWLALVGLESLSDARFTADLTFSGDLAAPDFGGTLRAEDLGLPTVPPLAFEAEFEGAGLARLAGRIVVERGPQTLMAEASLERSAQEQAVTVELSNLRWTRPGSEGSAEVTWALAEPTRLVWSPDAATAEFAGLRFGGAGETPAGVQIEPFQWDSLPGAFALSLQSWESAWLEAWTNRSLPAIALTELRVDARPADEAPWWTVEADLRGSHFRDDLEFPFQAHLALGEEGLRWRETSVAEHLQCSGQVPLRLGWAADGLRWEWATHRSMKVDLSLRQTEALPAWLADLSGLEAQGLRADLALAGTPMSPTGDLQVDATRLAWTGPQLDLPLVFHDLQARAQMDRSSLTIEQLGFRYKDRPATEVSLRLDEFPWQGLIESPSLALVDDLQGRIELKQFPVEPLADLFPAALDRTGQLELALDFSPGGNLTGNARIRGAALQPWPNGAVLRGIEADLEFAGRRVDITTLQAELSGKTVRVSGGADFRSLTTPVFDLRAEAEEIDLVRSENLILRSGFDLRLEGGTDEPATISGEVELRDSLWLQDLTDFASRGPAGGGTSSPPWFEVQMPPFADWKLDVRIRGEGFLDVRATVVEGKASAHFDLGGTLGQPLLTGEAQLDPGSFVAFPFARLRVETARAELTTARPHTLQLTARASGHAYGYQVQLEADGTAGDPELEFVSVPPLPQDQILLMLATGRQPQGDNDGDLASRGGRLAYYVGQDLLGELFGGGNSSRISIHSGDTLAQFGQETTAVEYRLNPAFSLVGEYDEFSDYNLNVRWRFFREGGEETPARSEDKDTP